jgi:hypothetical protein
VLAQLEQMDFDEDLPVEQRPFVELRIRLEKPEPGLRQFVGLNGGADYYAADAEGLRRE